MILMTERNLLGDVLKVINIGIIEFASSLEKQGIRVIHVNWAPPAQGDQALLKILDELL